MMVTMLHSTGVHWLLVFFFFSGKKSIWQKPPQKEEVYFDSQFQGTVHQGRDVMVGV